MAELRGNDREHRRETHSPEVQLRRRRHLHVRRIGLQHHKDLKPSGRGELEITDVNNAYIKGGKLEYDILDGWWADAGASAEKLLETSLLVARREGVRL